MDKSKGGRGKTPARRAGVFKEEALKAANLSKQAASNYERVLGIPQGELDQCIEESIAKGKAATLWRELMSKAARSGRTKRKKIAKPSPPPEGHNPA
jgi:hypothetical protein